MALFSWDIFVFFLKWGETVSLGTAVVSAPIVPTADDRRVNKYRTPVQKSNVQKRPKVLEENLY
jgi:hypothetical protein